MDQLEHKYPALISSKLRHSLQFMVIHMIYLQTILQRSEGELIRNIYQEMKADPCKGALEWVIKKWFWKVWHWPEGGRNYRDGHKKYKLLIKEKVRDHSFIQFKEMHAGHKKGRQNQHDNINSPQKYLSTNKLNNKQVSLLFNWKCQSVSGIKDNFHQQYPVDLLCPLCKIEVDSQNHILTSLVLKKHINIDPAIKYEFIHGSLEEQVMVITLYSSLLELREHLLEKETAYRGNIIPDS